MAEIKFKGNPVHTSGSLPAVGAAAPDFKLTRGDLSEASLQTYAGKRKILNINPSLDTGVCAASARKFNEAANSLSNTVVLNVSRDLPFAAKRFCGAEGLSNIEPLSEMRDRAFGPAYGVDMTDGPLAGLLSRAVVVVDENNKVIYAEQVPDITQEPNYDAVIQALK
jgi:thiol peroxidase